MNLFTESRSSLALTLSTLIFGGGTADPVGGRILMLVILIAITAGVWATSTHSIPSTASSAVLAFTPFLTLGIFVWRSQTTLLCVQDRSKARPPEWARLRAFSNTLPVPIDRTEHAGAIASFHADYWYRRFNWVQRHGPGKACVDVAGRTGRGVVGEATLKKIFDERRATLHGENVSVERLRLDRNYKTVPHIPRFNDEDLGVDMHGDFFNVARSSMMNGLPDIGTVLPVRFS